MNLQLELGNLFSPELAEQGMTLSFREQKNQFFSCVEIIIERCSIRKNIEQQ